MDISDILYIYEKNIHSFQIINKIEKKLINSGLAYYSRISRE